jgi:hypothetical protein
MKAGKRNCCAALRVLVVLLALWSNAGRDRADAAPAVTRGGDHGRVIRVTTLADQGQGSLRAAIEASGPRRVIFDVAGEIWPTDTLLIRNPGITIDAASAPSPGISIMGQKVRIRSHDVILRHLRIRIGARADGSDPDNRDALSIDGAENGREPSYNVLVENCSFAWAIDENIQLWGAGNHSIILRNNIIAEGLMRSIHPKGPHSMGLLVGPGITNVLVEGNLFAHNAVRNPLIDAGSSAVVANNLIYGALYNGFHIYAKPRYGPTLVSAIGNVVIASPGSRPRLDAFQHGDNPGTRIYYEDNVSIGIRAFDAAERSGKRKERDPPLISTPPISFPGFSPRKSAETEASVLKSAGARPWDRDAVDARIVAQVRSRTGGIVDEPSDPRLRAGATER